jgi:hypothetical protein
MLVVEMACDREMSTLTSHVTKSGGFRLLAAVSAPVQAHAPRSHLGLSRSRFRWRQRGADSRVRWSESAERISTSALAPSKVGAQGGVP